MHVCITRFKVSSKIISSTGTSWRLGRHFHFRSSFNIRALVFGLFRFFFFFFFFVLGGPVRSWVTQEFADILQKRTNNVSVSVQQDFQNERDMYEPFFVSESPRIYASRPLDPDNRFLDMCLDCFCTLAASEQAISGAT